MLARSNGKSCQPPLGKSSPGRCPKFRCGQKFAPWGRIWAKSLLRGTGCVQILPLPPPKRIMSQLRPVPFRCFSWATKPFSRQTRAGNRSIRRPKKKCWRLKSRRFIKAFFVGVINANLGPIPKGLYLRRPRFLFVFLGLGPHL